mmetsp:Transcript_17184/g.34822  ORF Transcript_17184/g.34822 Transcript_17184/m.34822 type:complete len:671 (-) Transcript_17184:87-2099(-)
MTKTATPPTLPPPNLKLRTIRPSLVAILLVSLLTPNVSAFTTLSPPVPPPSLARIAATSSSARLLGPSSSSSGNSFSRSQLFPTSINGVGFGGNDVWIRSLLPSGRIDGSSRSALYANLIPYDELMERLPSNTVLKAVEKANGAPIVASDLATKAGISLSQARKDLTALASLTRGDIAVSSDGDLIYTFPPNLSSVLSSNSAKYRAITTWREKIFPPLFYATKLGFGVVLLASLFAIFSTIFFLMTSGGASGDRDDDRRDGRRGGGMPMFGGGFWGPSPFDFFYYRPYYSRYYYSPAYSVGGGRRPRDPEEMGFLESVFSYVFGDGNPNGDVEERRIALVAEMIRQNGGAVTAEQLAPFCDDAPMPLSESSGKLGEERAYVDESFVLPIVTQLDGEPQVSEEGDIVYVFPELMTSASSSGSSLVNSNEVMRLRREARVLRRAGLEEDVPTSMIKNLLNMNGVSTRGALERSDLIDILEKVLPEDGGSSRSMDVDVDVEDPTLLQEREYKFSLASSFQTVLAGLLGVVNLGGALYLGNIFGQYALYGVRLPSYMGALQTFFPLLLGYAVLFNAIPLVRNIWIQRQNDQIRQRNAVRKSWRNLVGEKAGNIRRKLMAAARMGKRMKQLGAGGGKDIVFDTKREFAEVDKKRETDAMNDFDELLKQKENSAWE